MKRTAVALALTLGAASVVVMSPSWGAAACDVFSNTPYGYNSGGPRVGGDAGRSGCVSTVNLRSDLKYDRALSPDPVIGYKSGTVTNVTWFVNASCTGTRTYYIDTSSSSGQYSTSYRRTITC